MIQQMVSGANNGFMLKLTNETHYAEMYFASGDNPHINKHPLLQVCFTIPTGINELSNESIFGVYPNPSSGDFTITFPQTIANGNIEIINIEGKIIYTENVINISKKDIHLKNIPEGMYFVKIFDGMKNYDRKLIVDHSNAV